MIKITVMDFYLNPRTVTWKGSKLLVADYELFVMMIQSWVKGDKINPGMTKAEALDLAFSMR